MLKSPSSRMEGEMAQSCVRNSDRSEGKAGFGFWGAVNDCSNQGFGARQFKNKVFKGGGSRDGYDTCGDVFAINCGYSTTTPMMAWLVHVRSGEGRVGEEWRSRG